jgi:hypothetical protein
MVANKDITLKPVAVRVCQYIVIELNTKANTVDGSLYPAVSLYKFRKDTYDTEKKCFIGKPSIDFTFGIASALRLYSVLGDLLQSYERQSGNRVFKK